MYKNKKPSTAISIGIFVIAVGVMAYLRLHLFKSTIISLTYGLPLLICFWQRDRRLLWSMAGAFVVMSFYKTFFLLPEAAVLDLDGKGQWVMQVINILAIGGCVHGIINLTDRLRQKNGELEQSNEELAAREEEINHQNEELQSQGEELSQQNEELQQQSEELQQQSEELQAQTEELQSVNMELQQREALLQMLLKSLNSSAGDESLLNRICDAALELFGSTATAAAVVQQVNDELVVRACSGIPSPLIDHLPFKNSFAAVIISQSRPAYVVDLNMRPDLVVLRRPDSHFRSVLAAPVRIHGKMSGAFEIYAADEQAWTTTQIRMIEWIAAQCSLILEVRWLHEELMSTNAKLENLVQERTGRLKELVSELEHFSYTITHDMRAPLRAMQGFAELMEEESKGTMTEEHREYLERIRTSASRMDRLITDALNYNKALRQEIQLAPVDVASLLHGMLNSYPEFQSPRARIEIQGRLPRVWGSEAGLTQCFSNLLDNAIKFVKNGESAHVKIRAERSGEHVRLWIEDNGIGIPAEMFPKMFGMFQRGHRDYEGTGIGLALVQKVTDRMGGRVGVESELGNGSRFWLELKAAE